MQVDMTVRFPGGKKVEAEYKGYGILTDQPEVAGGEGAAPSPFDLFLASLGTCAGYYVLAFCQQRDLPTDDIRLSLRTVRDDATRLLSDVKIHVHLPESFPERYVKACVGAASLCTVKKHLQNPPSISLEASRNETGSS